MKKELGKISNVRFGMGGYQGVQFGLSLTFEMPGSGCGTFDGHWADPPSDTAQWTEADQLKFFGELIARVIKLMKQAKVEDVMGLKGVPVELEFDGTALKEWRILEEVL